MTLFVYFFNAPTLRPVIQAHSHPTADVAILVTKDPADAPIEPITQIITGLHLGEEFFSVGFPTDVMFQEGDGHPHRVLMGHYQRLMNFKSMLGPYTYAAGEMNVPNPKGMSGAPVLRQQSPKWVSGLATETIDVESLPSLVYEETIGGQKKTITEKRLIQYGVAVILEHLIDWINELIPPN